MTDIERKEILGPLSELSVDNLRCMRLTRPALNLAAQRVAKMKGCAVISIGGQDSAYTEILLAEEINLLFEAVKGVPLQ